MQDEGRKAEKRKAEEAACRVVSVPVDDAPSSVSSSEPRDRDRERERQGNSRCRFRSNPDFSLESNTKKNCA